MQIVDKLVYRTNKEFIVIFDNQNEINKKGCIIEAIPEFKYDEFKSLSYLAFIEPDKQIEILGSYDKIQLNNFKNICSSFP